MIFNSICLALLVCSFMHPCAGMQALAASALSTRRAPTIIKDVPYTQDMADRRRSFDLYLPPKTSTKPPLLIFVHGGFWLLSDDEYRIGPSLAENLVGDGVAVALVRYRLAPAHTHPAQTQDVAAAVARLIRDADKYGFDARRVFLSGHSAGGHLASLVALDGGYLQKHELASNTLAGVISFSGLYDLAPSWTVSKNQRLATERPSATIRWFSGAPRRFISCGPMRRDF